MILKLFSEPAMKENWESKLEWKSNVWTESTHSLTVDGVDSEESGREEAGGGLEEETGDGGVVEEDHQVG